MNSRVIYYIALALFSIIYVILSPHTPYPGSILLKAIPIWLVAGHVFLTLKDLKGRLLFIGLMFGSAGDIALATDYSLSFMIGLGFFLIGHLFYIACFSRQWKFQPVRLIPAGLVMILSIGLSIALTPRLGGLTIPVYAYVFIITLMVIFAVFRGAPSPAVWIGAVLFLLSDAIIAVQKFMEIDVPQESILIMASYYLAQILIGEGSIQDEKASADH
ncbi:MAG: hypothetical protein CMN76_18125 [Spirochaetaceae bacterium]|nr:hypothetical protein [Spirochaetaceae bacterium]|tara:strand:+ start:193895 stop:194545 length:651 start_codon:yes stop_codon:yes gene_type:complete